MLMYKKKALEVNGECVHCQAVVGFIPGFRKPGMLDGRDLAESVPEHPGVQAQICEIDETRTGMAFGR